MFRVRLSPIYSGRQSTVFGACRCISRAHAGRSHTAVFFGLIVERSVTTEIYIYTSYIYVHRCGATSNAYFPCVAGESDLFDYFASPMLFVYCPSMVHDAITFFAFDVTGKACIRHPVTPATISRCSFVRCCRCCLPSYLSCAPACVRVLFAMATLKTITRMNQSMMNQ